MSLGVFGLGGRGRYLVSAVACAAALVSTAAPAAGAGVKVELPMRCDGAWVDQHGCFFESSGQPLTLYGRAVSYQGGGPDIKIWVVDPATGSVYATVHCVEVQAMRDCSRTFPASDFPSAPTPLFCLVEGRRAGLFGCGAPAQEPPV